MPRKRQGRKGQSGRGVGTELLKKLLMESTGLIPKLLEGPTKELGNYLGSKIKKITGSGTTLAGGSNRLAGGSNKLAGGSNRLAGAGSTLAGGSVLLAGETPKRSKKIYRLPVNNN